ncbi:peptidylprolyl isomerase, partial [Amycolatopsis rhizosphaerae]
TEHGTIPLVLDRAKSPCAVRALLFLATKKYFDSSPCHRLVVAVRYKVLQCGDPSGTGWGGPGFTFKDKPPTGLQPARDGKVVYPAGTVAMAEMPGSSYGSQFLLIYGDTEMPASDPIVGTYRETGQATLDAIAAGGVEQATIPGTSLRITRPKTPVVIQSATVAA